MNMNPLPFVSHGELIRVCKIGVQLMSSSMAVNCTSNMGTAEQCPLLYSIILDSNLKINLLKKKKKKKNH